MSHPLPSLSPQVGARVIETGSDTAEFCLVDATSVPDDFATLSVAEQSKVIDARERAGRLWRIRTGYDGAYVLHVFVEQELPVQFAERCGEPLCTATIANESGKIVVIAAEDIGKVEVGDQRFSIPLTLGSHRATVWKIDWPEAEVAAAQKARVVAEMGYSAWAKRTRRGPWQVAVVIALILGGLVCLGSTLLASARASFGWKGLLALWGSWIAAIQIMPRVMSRADDVRAAQLEVETSKGFPDFVIRLSQVPA